MSTNLTPQLFTSFNVRYLPLQIPCRMTSKKKRDSENRRKQTGLWVFDLFFFLVWLSSLFPSLSIPKLSNPERHTNVFSIQTVGLTNSKSTSRPFPDRLPLSKKGSQLIALTIHITVSLPTPTLKRLN